MRTALALALALFLAAVPAAARPTDHVDPFIGTDGTGHTFPGAAVPFGMLQPGPDNADSGWDFTSGYQYRAPRILGFSQNRASGTGIPELGDLLLMPSATARDDMSSRKADERAAPGRYAVSLPDNGVRAEVTTTARVALHRWRFDRPGRVFVLVDLQHGLTFRTDRPRLLAATAHPVPAGLAGTVRARNWTERTMAFALTFSVPPASSERLPPRPGDSAPRFLLAFDLGTGATLLAKVALSTVDEDGAAANLATLPGWDWDAAAAAARRDWDGMLGRIAIDSSDRSQRRIFYTALYHALIHPSLVSDVDGRWRRPDGSIATAPRPRYSTLSLWDTFRAAQPLITLVAPERVDDIITTLLDSHDAAGFLPIWPIWGGETGTMIGNPALPIIADAWAKGFRGFDGPRALAAMQASRAHDHYSHHPAAYDALGYYPFDRVDGEAVSRTLETGIGDDAIARMAGRLGDGATAARFTLSAGGWRRLLDPDTRLARGRDSAGRWRTPFDPLRATSPLNNPGDYTEANAWQYSWTPALHDAPGLIAAMGGVAAFRAMLDRFFALAGPAGDRFLGQEATIGQYAHGNEPSHHVAWLYLLTDRPERGTDLVARIAREFYRDTPDGIIGNEDCGQMSAWYVFATLGLYPLQPASGSYIAGKPLVRRAVIEVPGRAPLTILRDSGPPQTGRSIDHAVLTRGGELRL